MTQTIRIATRNSKLALWQSEEVKRQLLALNMGLNVELLPILSDGDVKSEQGFQSFGYKGVFTKRIEAPLLDNRADIAVHSMKDLHSELPDSLMLAATLEREDPRDAFISAKYKSLEDLPKGATLGTASVRREAIIKQLRPDLNISPFRGNVPTRIEKLQRGDVDATLLAVAGLKRLKLDSHITQTLPLEVMLPAACQGAVGIECRKDDSSLRSILNMICHQKTFTAIGAERALLSALDGDCKTPLSAYATINGDDITIRAQWFDDGLCHKAKETANINEAEALGESIGNQLKKMAAA